MIAEVNHDKVGDVDISTFIALVHGKLDSTKD